jgi:hypothetical protein
MSNRNTLTQIVNAPSVTVNSTTETFLPTQISVRNSLFNSSNFDKGRPFAIHLRGFATGGTAATFQVKLYALNGAAHVAVAAFTVTGAAIPTTGTQFNLNAELQWDSVSQTINGTIYGQTGGTLTPYAVITTVTGIVASELSFVASVTFGAALATNTVLLTEFSAEQL